MGFDESSGRTASMTSRFRKQKTLRHELSLDSLEMAPAGDVGPSPLAREQTKEGQRESVLVSRLDGPGDGTFNEKSNSAEELFAASRPGWEVWATHVLMLAIPIALIIFVVVVWAKDGEQETTETINEWRNAAQVLSTLFPVFFATIGGRLMLQAARWRLEEGSSIGNLELLLGSRTLGGVLATQFHLKVFNLAGIVIMIFWVFSPLGAQATLRLVEPRSATRREDRSVVYFDQMVSTPLYPIAPSDLAKGDPLFTSSLGYYDYEINSANINLTIYRALFDAPMSSQQDLVDLWGNIKIPPLLTSEEGWTDVPETNTKYASLMGVPVDMGTLPATRNLQVEVESSYLVLDCAEMEIESRIETYFFGQGPGHINSSYVLDQDVYDEYDYFKSGAGYRVLPFETNGDTYLGYNVPNFTDVYRSDSPIWSLGVNRLIETDEFDSVNSLGGERLTYDGDGSLQTFQDNPELTVEPTRIIFQAVPNMYNALSINGGQRNRFPHDHASTTCGATQKYVQSRIRCDWDEGTAAHICGVRAQRPSQLNRPDENLTMLNWPGTFRLISKYFPKAMAERGLTEDPNGNYTNVALQIMTGVSGQEEPRFEGLDPGVFSERLGLMLNTYMQVNSLYRIVTSQISGQEYLIEMNQTAPAQLEFPVPVYYVSPLWAGLALVSYVVVLAAAVAGVVFSQLARGPEFLGSATAVIRDNDRVTNLPTDSGAMDGISLAAKTKGARVRYGLTGVDESGALLAGVGDEENVTKIKDVMK